MKTTVVLSSAENHEILKREIDIPFTPSEKWQLLLYQRTACIEIFVEKCEWEERDPESLRLYCGVAQYPPTGPQEGSRKYIPYGSLIKEQIRAIGDGDPRWEKGEPDVTWS